MTMDDEPMSAADLPGGPDLRAVADRLAVEDLTSRYADVVTRRAWPELAELLLPDAVVTVETVTRPTFTVTGPEELGRFVAGAVEHFDFFEFVVLNRVVDVAVDGDADRATGRLFICELRQHVDTGRSTRAFGRYTDDYRRVGGRWWIAGRAYRSMARSALSSPPDLEVLWHPGDDR
jgi:ketosteroid isomerase-like protein